MRSHIMPVNARTNASKTRSMFCGLCTRRGMGANRTYAHPRILALVHTLSLFNHCPSLDVHRDDYNATLNWVLVLDGGQTADPFRAPLCP
eukprot:262115-Amphidinium_carterae.1